MDTIIKRQSHTHREMRMESDGFRLNPCISGIAELPVLLRLGVPGSFFACHTPTKPLHSHANLGESTIEKTVAVLC